MKSLKSVLPLKSLLRSALSFFLAFLLAGPDPSLASYDDVQKNEVRQNNDTRTDFSQYGGAGSGIDSLMNWAEQAPVVNKKPKKDEDPVVDPAPEDDKDDDGEDKQKRRRRRRPRREPRRDRDRDRPAPPRPPIRTLTDAEALIANWLKSQNIGFPDEWMKLSPGMRAELMRLYMQEMMAARTGDPRNFAMPSSRLTREMLDSLRSGNFLGRPGGERNWMDGRGIGRGNLLGPGSGGGDGAAPGRGGLLSRLGGLFGGDGGGGGPQPQPPTTFGPWPGETEAEWIERLQNNIYETTFQNTLWQLKKQAEARHNMGFGRSMMNQYQYELTRQATGRDPDAEAMVAEAKWYAEQAAKQAADPNYRNWLKNASEQDLAKMNMHRDGTMRVSQGVAHRGSSFGPSLNYDKADAADAADRARNAAYNAWQRQQTAEHQAQMNANRAERQAEREAAADALRAKRLERANAADNGAARPREPASATWYDDQGNLHTMVSSGGSRTVTTTKTDGTTSTQTTTRQPGSASATWTDSQGTHTMARDTSGNRTHTVSSGGQTRSVPVTNWSSQASASWTDGQGNRHTLTSNGDNSRTQTTTTPGGSTSSTTTFRGTGAASATWTDPSGTTNVLTSNGRGSMTRTSIGPGGNVTVTPIDQTSTGATATYRDNSGNLVTLTSNGDGTRTQTTRAQDGSTTVKTIDTRGTFARWTDASGNQNTLTLNADRSRTLSTTGADGKVSAQTIPNDQAAFASAVAPDGTRVSVSALPGGKREVTTTTPAGNSSTVVRGGEPSSASSTLPDGTFVSVTNLGGGRREVVTTTPGGETKQEIRGGEGPILSATGPNGETITVTARPDGRREVTTATRDGNVRTEIRGGEPDSATAVLPDGRTISASRNPDGRIELTTTGADGKPVTTLADNTPTVIPPKPLADSASSTLPDGTIITATSRPDGTREITTATPDGKVTTTTADDSATTVPRRTGPDSASTTLPDGTVVTATAKPDGTRELTTTAPGGRTTTTTASDAPTTTPPHTGPDSASTTLPDGTVVTATAKPDGTRQVTATTPDGQTRPVNPDQPTTVPQQPAAPGSPPAAANQPAASSTWTDDQGNTHTLVVDREGNKTETVTGQNGQVTTTETNREGLVTETVRSAEGATLSTRQTDAAGNTIETTYLPDGDRKVTITGTAGAGELETHLAPERGETHFERRDANGNLIEQGYVDHFGRQHSTEFLPDGGRIFTDREGRSGEVTTTTVDASGWGTEVVRDANGNIISEREVQVDEFTEGDGAYNVRRTTGTDGKSTSMGFSAYDGRISYSDSTAEGTIDPGRSMFEQSKRELGFSTQWEDLPQSERDAYRREAERQERVAEQRRSDEAFQQRLERVRAEQDARDEAMIAQNKEQIAREHEAIRQRAEQELARMDEQRAAELARQQEEVRQREQRYAEQERQAALEQRFRDEVKNPNDPSQVRQFELNLIMEGVQARELYYQEIVANEMVNGQPATPEQLRDAEIRLGLINNLESMLAVEDANQLAQLNIAKSYASLLSRTSFEGDPREIAMSGPSPRDAFDMSDMRGARQQSSDPVVRALEERALTDAAITTKTQFREGFIRGMTAVTMGFNDFFASINPADPFLQAATGVKTSGADIGRNLSVGERVWEGTVGVLETAADISIDMGLKNVMRQDGSPRVVPNANNVDPNFRYDIPTRTGSGAGRSVDAPDMPNAPRAGNMDVPRTPDIDMPRAPDVNAPRNATPDAPAARSPDAAPPRTGPGDTQRLDMPRTGPGDTQRLGPGSTQRLDTPETNVSPARTNAPADSAAQRSTMDTQTGPARTPDAPVRADTPTSTLPPAPRARPDTDTATLPPATPRPRTDTQAGDLRAPTSGPRRGTFNDPRIDNLPQASKPDIDLSRFETPAPGRTGTDTATSARPGGAGPTGTDAGNLRAPNIGPVRADTPTSTLPPASRGAGPTGTAAGDLRAPTPGRGAGNPRDSGDWVANLNTDTGRATLDNQIGKMQAARNNQPLPDSNVGPSGSRWNFGDPRIDNLPKAPKTDVDISRFETPAPGRSATDSAAGRSMMDTNALPPGRTPDASSSRMETAPLPAPRSVTDSAAARSMQDTLGRAPDAPDAGVSTRTGPGSTERLGPGSTQRLDTPETRTGPGDTQRLGPGSTQRLDSPDSPRTGPGSTQRLDAPETRTGPGDTQRLGPGSTQRLDTPDTRTGPGDTQRLGPGSTQKLDAPDTRTGPGSTQRLDAPDARTGPGSTQKLDAPDTRTGPGDTQRVGPGSTQRTATPGRAPDAQGTQKFDQILNPQQTPGARPNAPQPPQAQPGTVRQPDAGTPAPGQAARPDPTLNRPPIDNVPPDLKAPAADQGRRAAAWDNLPQQQREQFVNDFKSTLNEAAAHGDKWAQRMVNDINSGKLDVVVEPRLAPNIQGLNADGVLRVNPIDASGKLRAPVEQAFVGLHEGVHHGIGGRSGYNEARAHFVQYKALHQHMQRHPDYQIQDPHIKAQYEAFLKGGEGAATREGAGLGARAALNQNFQEGFYGPRYERNIAEMVSKTSDYKGGNVDKIHSEFRDSYRAMDQQNQQALMNHVNGLVKQGRHSEAVSSVEGFLRNAQQARAEGRAPTFAPPSPAAATGTQRLEAPNFETTRTNAAPMAASGPAPNASSASAPAPSGRGAVAPSVTTGTSSAAPTGRFNPNSPADAPAPGGPSGVQQRTDAYTQPAVQHALSLKEESSFQDGNLKPRSDSSSGSSEQKSGGFFSRLFGND